MAIDYAVVAQRARALIEANGVLVTFQKLGSTPADPSKPWDGPASPRATVDASVSVPIVAVPPSSASSLGMRTVDQELLKRTQQIWVVAPGAELAFQLSTGDEAIREGQRWRIVFTETLRPATVTLLYFVGVAR